MNKHKIQMTMQKAAHGKRVRKPMRTRKAKQVLQDAIDRSLLARKAAMSLQKQDQKPLEQPKPAARFENLESVSSADDQLFQSRQSQELSEQKLTILPSTGSFDSAQMDKDETTGDYSKEGQAMSSPNRRVMDKIAQLETQVLAMGSRIQQLEIEKREDEGQLQLLQTKVRHFEESELPLTHQQYLINESSQDNDIMNLQLEEENVILDTISSLKDSIAGLFSSSKSKDKASTEAQTGQHTTTARTETSLDRLNRLNRESDE